MLQNWPRLGCASEVPFFENFTEQKGVPKNIFYWKYLPTKRIRPNELLFSTHFKRNFHFQFKKCSPKDFFKKIFSGTPLKKHFSKANYRPHVPKTWSFMLQIHKFTSKLAAHFSTYLKTGSGCLSITVSEFILHVQHFLPSLKFFHLSADNRSMAAFLRVEKKFAETDFLCRDDLKVAISDLGSHPLIWRRDNRTRWGTKKLRQRQKIKEGASSPLTHLNFELSLYHVTLRSALLNSLPASKENPVLLSSFCNYI